MFVIHHLWINKNPETFMAAITRLEELYFTKTFETETAVAFESYNPGAAIIAAGAGSAQQPQAGVPASARAVHPI